MAGALIRYFNYVGRRGLDLKSASLMSDKDAGSAGPFGCWCLCAAVARPICGRIAVVRQLGSPSYSGSVRAYDGCTQGEGRNDPSAVVGRGAEGERARTPPRLSNQKE